MAISSVGIGSGLDVEKIVTQMVELEKSPIKTLKAQADVINSKISTYGEIKSKVDALNSAVSKLTRDSGWNGVNISSTSSSVVGTMTGIASPGTYNMDVTQLARSQTSVSARLASGTKMGSEGIFKFEVGTSNKKSFEVSIGANDTLETVAASINTQAGGALVASVITDSAGQQQLMIRSKNTGTDGEFKLDIQPKSGGVIAAGSALERLTAGATGTVGAADYAEAGFSVSQTAENAKIKLNGVSIESSTNTFADTIPGLTVTVSGLTTNALLTANVDTDSMKTNIQAFVDAYNDLNDMLSASTKYDQDTKVGGILQGDSGTVSLQNALRMLTQRTAVTGGKLNRLADIGIQMQQGGKLSMDATKLAAALKTPDALKSLFANKPDSQGSGGGIAMNFKSFTDDLLSWTGAINNKTDSLEGQLKKNSSDQDKVTGRATRLETRLRAQYSALDVKMSSLTALNSYVSQMVTSWNKSKD